MLIPGKRSQVVLITCLIGVAGARGGGWVATRLFHVYTLDGFFNLSTWLIAIAGAAVLLLAYHLVTGRSSGGFAYRQETTKGALQLATPAASGWSCPSLGGAWAGGCCVHGGPGGSGGGTGGNHQQRNRFPVACCGHADCVAGNGGEPVDPGKVAVVGGEPVRDVIPFVAVDGQPLHSHAGPGVQRRDERGQLGMCVAG